TGIRYEWYALQRCAATYWQEFEQPKILYQEIATYQAFSWDSGQLYVNNKVFFIPNSTYYLLSILNSSITWFFLDRIVGKMAGGTYALQSIYIAQIPIPNAQPQEKSAIETLVNYIIYLTAQLKDIPSHGQKMVETAEDKLMLSYFEQIVDALVMELYLPEELHNHDKYFMRHLLSENLPAIETIKGDKMQALRQIFKQLFNSEHPIRANIYFLNSLEVVRMIRGLA
ncbi:TaqI-like C-terminal specificity domain-containing protein, partial [Planktothrix sp.]